MLDFLGIGAQKCGTSWLYKHLARHPQIRFPADKEVHFWDVQRSRGIPWWLALFAEAPPGVKQGEITPGYAFLDHDAIAHIREAVPHVRLFFAIRNPIARAWSSALMAMTRAEMSIDEASDAWFLDHFGSKGSRLRGDYAACLDSWLEFFPTDALQVILMEEIQQSPEFVLRRLAAHVEVDASRFDWGSAATLRVPVFRGPDVDLRRSLLGHLREQYRPGIVALEHRLGRSLSHWLTWDGRR